MLIFESLKKDAGGVMVIVIESGLSYPNLNPETKKQKKTQKTKKQTKSVCIVYSANTTRKSMNLTMGK